MGRAGPARPLEQGKPGRTNVFVFFFTQNVCTRLVWRHQPPSFIIMASQGALAPRLARSIRVLGHPYSSMWGTNTSPKRGDRLWVPHKRGMGSIAIVMRGMWKIDEKSWWHSSFHHGWRALQWRAWGRSCAPNTASRAPIFEYTGHGHVYQGSAAGEQSMLHRPPVFKEAVAPPATAFLAPGAPTPLSQALRPPPLHIERPEGGPPTMDAALINLCTLEA